MCEALPPTLQGLHSVCLHGLRHYCMWCFKDSLVRCCIDSRLHCFIAAFIPVHLFQELLIAPGTFFEASCPLGSHVAPFGCPSGGTWSPNGSDLAFWGARVAPWAPQGVTMSAIWLPKGWLWGTKGVTFGTMGEPWGPHGAKTRPWKGQNSEIAYSSTVLIHFRGLLRSHWKQVKPGDHDQLLASASRAEKLRYLEATWHEALRPFGTKLRSLRLSW